MIPRMGVGFSEYLWHEGIADYFALHHRFVATDKSGIICIWMKNGFELFCTEGLAKLVDLVGFSGAGRAEEDFLTGYFGM